MGLLQDLGGQGRTGVHAILLLLDDSALKYYYRELRYELKLAVRSSVSFEKIARLGSGVRLVPTIAWVLRELSGTCV